ncbi:MAG TPA: AAA family ATPase [Saprospiraceae bacterium]|nr:AAA family ATPase [Saprospiraceae bacterium]MCC6447866.1 AAA family ATPase [Chitinophagaceae bacterium]MBK6667148.1 AAA family ATPase [Saprospiraceae bacterium]MBK7699141.1 AAA family ATPase [Saprospiraceae bacterium]MBK8825459.1 AAA family ATPase [Saprospiraceae bacterium]
MKSIIFFNNKGGVGKTTTVYHVAWMLSELGIKTIAVDLDPQSNLTSMFLTPSRLEDIYEKELPITILDSINPVVSGDPYQPVHIEEINENLGLILGNLSLSLFEDKLSDAWLKSLGGDSYSFRMTSIFNTIFNEASNKFQAEILLIDVGPNLGAINRAVSISSDYIIMPVASDLFSLQGIKNLGQTLGKWKRDWKQRLDQKPDKITFEIPTNKSVPIGYIVMQYSAKESRPVKSYLRWANRIPSVFAEYVLGNSTQIQSVEEDIYCIALLKHYRSLAPMSMESHKPIFLLKPADGAIGAHVYAVQRSYQEFEILTKSIITRCKNIH